jgi:hypothetical protein
MASITHAVFIDESGNGSPGFSVQRLWITAAVAIPLEMREKMDEGIARVVASHFRPWMKELKGSDLPRGLRIGSSIEEVALEVVDLMRRVEARVWITVCQGGASPPPSLQIQSPLPKDIARQLMLERVSGFLRLDLKATGLWLLIWDITDQQELCDFSRSIVRFRDTTNGEQLNSRLVPALLGGLSHDWSGLQAADLFANMALHRQGMVLGLPGARAEKAMAFRRHLEPCLQRDSGGNAPS